MLSCLPFPIPRVSFRFRYRLSAGDGTTGPCLCPCPGLSRPIPIPAATKHVSSHTDINNLTPGHSCAMCGWLNRYSSIIDFTFFIPLFQNTFKLFGLRSDQTATPFEERITCKITQTETTRRRQLYSFTANQKVSI